MATQSKEKLGGKMPKDSGKGKAAAKAKDAPKVKEAPSNEPVQPQEPARMRLLYEKTLRAQLMKELRLVNVNQAPRLKFIVVSMGVGEAKKDQAFLQEAANELGMITGQKAMITHARKSVSNFQLREGMAIGCKVTLRGERMYEFLERLVCIALPRIRDFRGVSLKAFDGRGNYSLGITDQLIFPEIDPDKAKRTQGMNIAFVSTARTDEQGRALLRAFGMPFMTIATSKDVPWQKQV